jgi:hypothetical protein
MRPHANKAGSRNNSRQRLESKECAESSTSLQQDKLLEMSGRQVCEAGEPASGTQRGDAAAATESLCSHALPLRTVAEALKAQRSLLQHYMFMQRRIHITACP